ncbi:MAG TPA: tetratricopeptide repeat protein [Thermomicrobiaceae bacterium]|nr:tetratricopeptide repeat protein [Thermomicrobiaceae bacterium]
MRQNYWEGRRMAQVDEDSLGALLSRYRRERGLTQLELAERTGGHLSVNTIGNIERDRTRPYRHSIEALCAALDLATEERAAVLLAWRHAGAETRRESLAAADQADSLDATAPLTLPASPLPRPPAPLLGRAEEVSALAALLTRAEVQLVTLTGPAGVGKTRLALAIAAALTDYVPGRVVFVPLAPLDDPALVLAAIAHACGLRESGSARSPGEQLAAALVGRETLVVLDNCEHLLAAAPEIAALLAGVPCLTLLATSRAPLRLRGESVYPVAPLGLPDLAGPLNAATLATSPAAALFMARARAVRPDFTLTDANAPDVAAICTRLDGLPLAIELAAARVDTLPPAALAARLEHSLDLLTGGPFDLPDRHRALRAAIAWSERLLAPAERRLFARLAVFAGAATLEAIAAVCDDDGRLGIDALDGVTALVRQSLVRRVDETEGAAEPRFAMLATIREYALERLASEDRTAVERAHGDYVLALAERARGELRGGEVAAWLDRLEAERADLRAALRRALDRGESERVQRLAGALGRFWIARGFAREGQRWTEEALALGGPAPPAARAGALDAAGLLAVECRQLTHGQECLEECLRLRRALGDLRGTAETLATLASAVALNGDNTRAIALLEESLALHRQGGHRWGVAIALNNLADKLYNQREDARAETLLHEALAVWDELGDRGGRALSLGTLGEVALAREDFDRARALFAESLACARAGAARNLIGSLLADLALTQARAGDAAGARSTLREAIAASQATGARQDLVRCLLAGAELAAAGVDPARAVRLWAAAEGLRTRLGAAAKRVERTHRARLISARRQSSAALWQEGYDLPPDQALALALEIAAPRQAARSRHVRPLTGRATFPLRRGRALRA